MRILHVITGLETGGAETALHGLLRSLDPAVFSHGVVSLIEPGFMGARIRHLGVDVDTLSMRRGRPTPGALFRLARLIRQAKPDAVMTWLYHADLLGLLAAGMAGKPPVVWNLRCAHMDFSQYNPLTRLTMRVCARLSGRPAAVLANSEAAREHHLGLGYHPKRFEVIENGVDIDRFQPDEDAYAALRSELDLEPQDLLVGAAMRYDPMKNLPGWLDAAARILCRKPDARFVLCGAGMEPGNPELADLVAARGLEARVHLLGQRPDVQNVLAGLDLYLSASLGESFPSAAAEAMACGTPCVLTDVGGSARVAGDAGRVVPAKDNEALALAAYEILSLPLDRRKALGLAGRRRVAEHFSMDRMARAYAQLFLSLAE